MDGLVNGVLVLVLLLTVAMGSAQRTPHRFKMLTTQRINSVMQCSNIDSLRSSDFPAILKERVPDTPGHTEVKNYIVSRLSQLDCSRWNVTEHTFEDDTPLGRKNFTNIIATLDPAVDKRLVLAAHYDSKVIDGARFLGATDSALSVALLIDMALTLDSKLQERELSSHSLQLIFTDGEEAFRTWSDTDSIYGARQLAADMEQPSDDGLLGVSGKSALEAMEAFMLLDLIGSTDPYPAFHDMYSAGSALFQRLVKIEDRLATGGHLESHPRKYFKEQSAHGWYNIGDDHTPFLERGVPIVHLITYPFPRVWHKAGDNADAIDWKFVSNFRRIMMVFLHEYFHLH